MPYEKEGRPGTIKAYIPLINEIISSLGVDPASCYNEEKTLWSLQKNSAKVDIILFSISGEDGSQDYIEVCSPVLKVPESVEKDFYKKLLEINNTSIGVKFAVDNAGWSWLLVQRELEGLDRNEIITMLERIGNFSNDMQNELKKEFSL